MHTKPIILFAFCLVVVLSTGFPGIAQEAAEPEESASPPISFETLIGELADRTAASALLNGTWGVSPPLAERIGRSSVLTMPLPFASRCRITRDASASFGVAARRYDPSATVRTFESGDFEPVNGQYMIQIQATAMGENSGIPIQFRPEAKRYAFGLDCVTITSPKRDVK